MRNLSWIAAVCLISCGQGPGSAPDPEGEADTDTGTDADPSTDADGDGFGAEVDCDDGDLSVFPGAPDLCGDQRVTDCDRVSDAGLVTLDGIRGFEWLDDALAAASPGSEVLLCQGTYVGNFEAAVPVRIRSLEGKGSTVLSGSEGTTLSVPGGSEIVGLTIRDGRTSERGGGIRMTSEGTLRVEDCLISDNQAAYGGGISVAEGGTATLVGTEVRRNRATLGGAGIAVSPGGVLDLSGGSRVSNNLSVWFGGGIWLQDAALIGGVVTGNELDEEYEELLEEYEASMPLPAAAVGGAGVAATGISSLTGTEIHGNVGDGGGISLVRAEVSLVDVSIHENEGPYGGGLLALDAVVRFEGGSELAENDAVWGGGAAVFGSELIGGTIRNNEAADDGGGLWMTESSASGTSILVNLAFSGGGIRSQGHVTLSGVLVRGNEAEEGGGISTSEALDEPAEEYLTVIDSDIASNFADDGGAVYASSDVSLIDTRVSDNTARSLGGGVRLYVAQPDGPGPTTPGPTVAITRGALLRNTAARGGGIEIGHGRVEVDRADLGSGADDNAPEDLWVGGAPYDYGADAAFSCDESGCAP